MVSHLKERYGVRPDFIEAALGPAIGPCCYEIGGDVSLSMPGQARYYRQPIPAGCELLFEVEMLSVRDEPGSEKR